MQMGKAIPWLALLALLWIPNLHAQFTIGPDDTLRVGIEDGCDVAPGETGYDTRARYERDGSEIKFEFNCDGGLCLCGRFANGHDYWVAPRTPGGEVTITRMTPEVERRGITCTESGCDTGMINGAMKDPDHMNTQAFIGTSHQRITGPTHSLNLPDSFSVDTGEVGRPTSIVKSKALPSDQCTTSGTRQCIEYYEILTVTTEPPGNVFRPPFFGDEKPMYAAEDLDMSRLSDLPQIEGAMSFSEAIARVRSPAIGSMAALRNNGEGWNARVNNQANSGYHGRPAQQRSAALLPLSLEEGEGDDGKKETLARFVAQRAIDHFYIFKNGANDPGVPYSGYRDWSGVSGEGCGANPGIGGYTHVTFEYMTVGAALLEANDWLDHMNSVLSTRDGQQCTYATGFVQANDDERGMGIPTFGHLDTQIYSGIGNCNDSNRNCASVGGSDDPDYALYDGNYDGDPLGASGSPTSYQQQAMAHWQGPALLFITSPRIREFMPENGEHWFEFVKHRFRIADELDFEGGAASANHASFSDAGESYNGDTVSLQTYNTSYTSSGVLEVWGEYIECAVQGDCAGMVVGD